MLLLYVRVKKRFVNVPNNVLYVSPSSAGPLTLSLKECLIHFPGAMELV